MESISEIVRSRYAILAPTGGFGNHLRWLCLLDDKFKFRFIANKKNWNWNLEKYNSIKDPTWPEFDSTDISHYPLTVQQEIRDILNVFNVDFTDLENKIEFINKEVYAPTRSWHNWLNIEWKFREVIDQYIWFSHNDYIDNFDKKIILNISPDLAYRSYVKLNSNLNNLSEEIFKKFGCSNIESSSSSDLVLNGDILFQPTLDQKLYRQVIDYFDLDDHYDLANTIHNTWYTLHKKAERDIVLDLAKLYKVAL